MMEYRFALALALERSHLHVLVSSNLDVLWVAPVVAKLGGYEPEELIGRNATELIHPDDLITLADVFAYELSHPLAGDANRHQDIQAIRYRVRLADKAGGYTTFSASGTNLLAHPDVRALSIILRVETYRQCLDDALEAIVTDQPFEVVSTALSRACRVAFGPESSAMIIVNGPVRSAIGMNWQGNVLGQGNRANATIGRALQLAVRNIGGGRPQEADQAAFGHPGKYTFCFAEDDSTPWTTLAQDRGIAPDRSAATVFSADGVLGCADQKSRAPEGLIYSLAGSLRGINHVDMVNGADVVIVIGPEHGRVFDQAGWSKTDTVAALQQATRIAGRDLGMTASDKAAAAAPTNNDATTAPLQQKFRAGGITLVRAGGAAGMFSAIIPGWLMKGPLGTDPVTKEITP